MAEWTQCTSCGLRFRERADGRCPRCGRGAPAEATPPPAATALPEVFDEAAFARRRQERAAEAGVPATVGSAVRVAGGLLVVNGLLQLIVQTLESASAGALALLDPWLASFDVVVGGILLSGQGQVRRWATVRAAVGGLGLAALHLLGGHHSTSLLGALLGAGLLLLLVREAGLGRAVIGSLAAGAAVVLGALAVSPYVGLRNPMGALSAALDGEIEWQAARAIEGSEVAFKVDLPDGWHVRREHRLEAEAESSEAKPGGPRREVSPSVRRADANLDVQLMGLQFPPERPLDADVVMDALVTEVRDSFPGLMVAEDAPLPGAHGVLRVVEGTAWIDGQRTAVALGFAVRGQCIVLLNGTAPPRMYATVREDLLAVFSSVQTRNCGS